MPTIASMSELEQLQRALRRRLRAQGDPFESDCLCAMAPTLARALSAPDRTAQTDRTGRVMDLIQCRCQAVTPGSLMQFDDLTLHRLARTIVDLFDGMQAPSGAVADEPASWWFG